jgi:hypothetical protein
MIKEYSSRKAWINTNTKDERVAIIVYTYAAVKLDGPAKKGDFRGITAKNANQKQFFSNFIGLNSYP